MSDMNILYNDIYHEFDLDMSLPLSEASDEGQNFMDYYIRMEELLSLERSVILSNRDQLQADLRAQEEEEEIEYYVRQYEDTDPIDFLT